MVPKDVLMITNYETVGGGLSPDKGAVGAKWKVERVKWNVGVSWRFAQELTCFASRGYARYSVRTYLPTTGWMLEARKWLPYLAFFLLPLNFAPPTVLQVVYFSIEIMITITMNYLVPIREIRGSSSLHSITPLLHYSITPYSPSSLLTLHSPTPPVAAASGSYRMTI